MDEIDGVNNKRNKLPNVVNPVKPFKFSIRAILLWAMMSAFSFWHLDK